MKITFEANDLAAALSVVKGASQRQSTIPALSMALIEAENGRMSLQVTNAEQFASSSLPCNGEAEAVCVPVWFLETLAGQAGARIALAFNDQKVKALTGATRLSADTLPAIDFPSWEPTLPGLVSMPASELLAGLMLGLPATDHPALTYLQGVNWRPDEGGVTLTGTNSYVILTARLAGVVSPQQSFTIPADTIRALAALIGKDRSDNVTIEISTTALAFSYRAHRLVSKVVEGDFPDLSRVIPDKHEHFAAFDGEEAFAIVSRVRRAISAARTEKRIPIRVKPTTSGLLVGRGDVVVDLVPAEIADGLEEFGIEARFLTTMLDGLIGMGGKAFQLFVREPGSPILLTAEGIDATAVAMPLHTIGIPELESDPIEQREAA